MTICWTTFQISKVKVTEAVQSFMVYALWLIACLTDLLHVWHKYNPWGDNMLRKTFM